MSDASHDVLVTGASGAIGTALCERLAGKSTDVVGVARTEPRWDVGVPVKRRDLTSSPTLPDADVIVHLAAHARVPPVVEDPRKAFENVAMTEPVLEHARRTDASVVFASSREVYGAAIRPSESDVTLTSANPYGGSKLACEAMVESYHECYDVPVTTLRLSNTYGRYDANTRVVPIFVALASAGEPLTVFGEDSLLDFVHVDDVVDAFLATIERSHTLRGETINIGSGAGTALTTLASHVVETIDECPGYGVEPDRSGEVSRFVADVSKARALLDWDAETPLEAGLPRTIDWYQSQPELLAEIRQAVGTDDS